MSGRSYEAALGAEPLSVMPHRCALLRKAKAAGFGEVDRDGATHEYRYEKVDMATNILGLTSTTLKMAQRIRFSKSPLLTIQGDGSEVQKMHTFTIDVRYIDVETNVTHTEFLEMVNCKGDAKSMVNAILDALGEKSRFQAVVFTGQAAGSFTQTTARAMRARPGTQRHRCENAAQ